MEITILNTGEDETAFHETASGEVGTALRKAGKDYIGHAICLKISSWRFSGAIRRL